MENGRFEPKTNILEPKSHKSYVCGNFGTGGDLKRRFFWILHDFPSAAIGISCGLDCDSCDISAHQFAQIHYKTPGAFCLFYIETNIRKQLAKTNNARQAAAGRKILKKDGL